MIRKVLLDRNLALPWLDTALTMSLKHSDPMEARHALRDSLVSAPLADTARKKTVTALSRTWITPCPEASSVIQWAQENQGKFVDSRPLHLGALLATQPFFASLLSETGRMFFAGATEVNTSELRRRMKGLWGARRSVDVSVQRGVQTMRALGLLEGQPASSRSVRSWIEVTPEVAAWLARGLLLARDADSIGTEDLRLAPELFSVRWPRRIARSAVGVEEFAEGNGRTVLVRNRG